MWLVLKSIFFVLLICVQPNASLDVKKLLYKYVAVCGFDHLCDPKMGLLPKLNDVPTRINSSGYDYCEPCSCFDDCCRYVLKVTFMVLWHIIILATVCPTYGKKFWTYQRFSTYVSVLFLRSAYAGEKTHSLIRKLSSLSLRSEQDMKWLNININITIFTRFFPGVTMYLHIYYDLFSYLS